MRSDPCRPPEYQGRGKMPVRDNGQWMSSGGHIPHDCRAGFIPPLCRSRFKPRRDKSRPTNLCFWQTSMRESGATRKDN